MAEDKKESGKGYEVLEGETPGGMISGSFSALGAVVKAEIDMQVTTAKTYPRSITKFQREALSMATLTEKIAGECIYALPRRERDKSTGQMIKKTIEGPSARLAEIILSAWGNCRAGARPVGEDNEFVTCQGFFVDVERNVAVSRDVKRRITSADGRRYSPDMIVVTTNAASSIAQRNAVLAGIPKAFWSDIYDEARKTAIGDAKTLANKRGDMIAHFGKMGVTPDMILETLGVKGIDDIGLEELAELKGTATALKEGDITVEEAFPKSEKETAKQERKKGTDGIKDAMKEKQQPQGTAEAASGDGNKAEPAQEKKDPPPTEDPKKEEPEKAEPAAEAALPEKETEKKPPASSEMELKAMAAMDEAVTNAQLDRAWTKNVPADLKTKNPEAYKLLAEHYNGRMQSFRARAK